MLAGIAPGRTGRLPAVEEWLADQLHVRGHSQPDRPRLSLPVPAGLLLGPGSVGRAGPDLARRLGGVRAVSDPAFGFQLRGGQRAGELAASQRARGALGQEQQPCLAFRHLVLEPVPSRRTIHGQRRRLRDAELHPNAGHDDPGTAGRREPAPAPDRDGRRSSGSPSRAGSAWRPAGDWASWASARWSSGSGLRAGSSSAAAGASCSWPASMRSSTSSASASGPSR